MKYWRISYQEALWGVSFQNLMMLNVSIPHFDENGKKKEAPAKLKGADLKARHKKKK